MQHLDEGTIHSWLDSALTPDEAARVEAHVAECAQCAAAVAEARGFIAASSRILTALDNAPRGVMPVAAPRKRVDPMVWRIAATLLVVAGGTLVVARNRGADEQLMSAKTDPVTLASEPAVTTAQAPSETAPVPAVTDQASPQPERSKALSIARPEISAQRVTAGAGAARGQIARAPDLVDAPTSAAPTFAPSRVAAAAAMDAAAEPQLLKVVGSPRRIGAKITLYEVVPGDTVTLTESIPVELSPIVLRGPTSMSVPAAQNAREKSAAAPSKARADVAASAAETRPVTGVAGGASTAPQSAPTDNAVHTITWTDSTTRNTLSLSGRMPEARLQEIRIRIERERAAAANKNP
jgi:putative zinc finger protein